MNTYLEGWDSIDRTIAFHIGSMPVSWYGILIGIGLFISISFMLNEWIFVGGSITTFGWVLTVGLISGFLGSRWIYLILNPQDIEGMVSFFTFSSGRSILGGIIGGSLGVMLFLKVKSLPINYRMVASIALPHMLLGQAIGRWGNFANGEVYGGVVSAEQLEWLTPWLREGMLIENSSGVWEYHQPLFLIEFITNLIGWFLIAIMAKQIKQLKPGTHGAMYFMWYGTSRACMELFRDEKFIMNINGFPTSFFVAILMAVVGLILFIYFQFYYWDFQEWKENVYAHKKAGFKIRVKIRWNYLMKKTTKKQKELELIKVKEETEYNIKDALKRNKKYFDKQRVEDKYCLKETSF